MEESDMNYFKLLWELRSLKNNTKKTKIQMEKLQKEKLSKILHYAYDHSDYYRTAFMQAGITKQTIDITPISEFPSINKKELIKHFDKLVTVDDVKQSELQVFDELEDTEDTFKNNYHVVHSSGSTGKPGYFIYDEQAWNHMLLGIIRGALWDMSMWDILKLLWKTPRIVYIAACDGRYGGAMAVGSGIEGVRALQLSLDIKQPLDEWINQIQKFKPSIVIGYSSAIKILAEQVSTGKVSVQIKRIISCGEPLNANLRSYLEQIFHCDIVNFYGASESLALGVELHGEEGMYLGFSHLHSFLSSIFGFGLAGILLTEYCPDPALFETRAAWEAASGNAHYIWYYFAAIGLIAAIALLLFAKITESIDKKKKANQ